MSDEHVTLLAPDVHAAPRGAASSGFPSDLLNQSAIRLRTLALLYAVVFLLAGVVPQLTIAEERAHFLETPIMWLPSVIGIFVALVVAAVIHFGRVTAPTAITLGLIF